MGTRYRIERAPDGTALCEVAIPVNALSKKMGAGRGFDSARIAEADRSVGAIAAEYVRQVGIDLQRMAVLSARARRAAAGGEPVAMHLEAVRWLAHDLRGLAGSFGFTLAGHVASMLYDVLARDCALDAAGIDLVDLHVGALRALFDTDTRGAVDDAGRCLLAGLDAAIRKRAPRTVN